MSFNHINIPVASTTERTVITSEAELAQELMKKIHNSREEMSEEDKEKMNARIQAKLKAGKKLSPEEAKYLQETDPQMYMQYQRIRAMADTMAQQLKHAKSKQQANDMITTSMSSVSDKDPYKEYVLAAMNEVAKDFKKSPEYSRLPDKESDLHHQETVKNHVDCSEEEEKDDFDPMLWSPLQEVIDAMPTFHVSV